MENRKNDYCLYTINNCKNNNFCLAYRNESFTYESILNDYKNSSYYKSDKSLNLNFFICQLKPLLKEIQKNNNCSNNFVQIIINRCHSYLDSMEYSMMVYDNKTFSNAFDFIVDFMWVYSSSLKANKKDNTIILIQNPKKELEESIQILIEKRNKIDLARADLKDMIQARDLPLFSRFFLVNVANDRVRYYADSNKISIIDLKKRIDDCNNYILEEESLYYTMLISLFLKNYLRFQTYGK